MSALETFAHTFAPAKKPNAPVLLLLHGTGGDERDLVPLARSICSNAAILAPRGQVKENGMNRFFRRFAEGVFDVEDLKARTHGLADFVAAAAEHYGFEPGKVVVIGYSNGANIASSLLLLRPEVVHCAALLRPMVPFEPDRCPDLSGRRILLAAGAEDRIAPPSHARRLAEVFACAGAEITLRVRATGHGLSQGDVADLTSWIRPEQEATAVA